MLPSLIYEIQTSPIELTMSKCINSVTIVCEVKITLFTLFKNRLYVYCCKWWGL